MVCIRSKNHTNVVNLIDKYEARFQTVQASGVDWRLEQYLKTIYKLLDDEEKATGKLNDELITAKKKADFFKGLLEAQSKSAVLEKYQAINAVPALVPQIGSSSINGTRNQSTESSIRQRNLTKAIHLNKAEQEIRRELLQQPQKGLDSEGSKQQLSAVKLHSGKNFDDIVKYHKLLQENVTNEMIELTRNLKHNITVSNEIVRKDTELLEKTNVSADTQYSKLRQNTNKISEFANKACEYWLWISIAIVVVTFLTMVIFIRLF